MAVTEEHINIVLAHIKKESFVSFHTKGLFNPDDFTETVVRHMDRIGYIKHKGGTQYDFVFEDIGREIANAGGIKKHRQKAAFRFWAPLIITLSLGLWNVYLSYKTYTLTSELQTATKRIDTISTDFDSSRMILIQVAKKDSLLGLKVDSLVSVLGKPIPKKKKGK